MNSTITARSETLQNIFVIQQCREELKVLVCSLFLAKNDRGDFNLRGVYGAVIVVPLAQSDRFITIHVGTFLCYTVWFAGVPVTVAR